MHDVIAFVIIFGGAGSALFGTFWLAERNARKIVIDTLDNATILLALERLKTPYYQRVAERWMPAALLAEAARRGLV